MRVLAGLLVLAALTACVSAPRDVTLETSQGSVNYRIDGGRARDWGLNPALNPDVLEAGMAEGARADVCFVSERDEQCFNVGVGESRDFVISRDGVAHNTRITGVVRVPAAVFSPEYQAAHRGRTLILIPETYELFNIAVALTEYATANPGLVMGDDYLERVRAHFAPWRDHQFVRDVNAAITADQMSYFTLKMNAYAFEFDGAGRIVRSPVYDRMGWGEASNSLLPFMPAMQAFADESGFRAFFAANQPLYQRQIAYMRDEVDIAGMNTWLRREFPSVAPYDGVKIIFSPLVGYNQSLLTLDENGYRELQPHVNYPYNVPDGLTAAGAGIVRGRILFTELNHGFINPTADRYAGAIDAAIAAREPWADDTKPARTYPNDYALFNEYMNWGLVSLYELDYLSEADRAIARPAVERALVDRRGFRKFEAFNAFLLDLYANRAPGETLETLYPRIIAWFAAETAAQRAVPDAPG
ncbi:hypothetical protein U91I_03194 [alpha proteobacterium U9-1i]|nr:hypothetical protein U91I_03194 [alpha proteobacterium U9-1i]